MQEGRGRPPRDKERAALPLSRAVPLRSALSASSPPCMQIWRRGGRRAADTRDWAAAVSPLPAAVASDILPAGAAAAKRERRGRRWVSGTGPAWPGNGRTPGQDGRAANCSPRGQDPGEGREDVGPRGPRPLLSFCRWGFCCGGRDIGGWAGLLKCGGSWGLDEDPLSRARVGRGCRWAWPSC